MPSPNEISVTQLSRLIGLPNSPVIIDVRTDSDFDQDPQLIPTAFRYPFNRVADLAPRLTAKKVVIYCQKGKKISHGATALLQNQGIVVEYLCGGQFAWRDANLPMVWSDKLPPFNRQNQTVWVTKHRPKIDRIACPWLIRRFIDPRAQFLFVAPAEVSAVADKFGAAPFDIENVYWSHRGDKCTFDTLIEEFGIATPTLNRLAAIVRAADTNCIDACPQAAGLLAASLGLSRMYKNDLEQLDAGMALYDMFYRWARDAVTETHDWQPTSARV